MSADADRAATGSASSSRRQAARSRPAARRRAHVDGIATSSCRVAGRSAHTSTPSRDQRPASARRSMGSWSIGRSRRSRSSIETVATAVAPGASSEAMPRAAASSSASAPRSSDPHGKARVMVSATPRRSSGICSAAASAKSALAKPPLAAGRSARRDASAIDVALASMPMTRVAGSSRARARTARPSPVPRSTWTRSARAIRW